MAKDILDNIDEKPFLDQLISLNMLVDLNVFKEVDIFGSLESNGNNISLSFSDPSIVVNTSKRKFKRRLVFYPKENTDHSKIIFDKLPLSYEDPITRTVVDSSGGIFGLFEMTSSSSTTPGIVNFSFNKQIEKLNSSVSLSMKINAPYRTDFYGAKVKISNVEKYDLSEFNREFVYLITLDLDFSECKLSNKIFAYSSLKVIEAMDNLVGAVNNNDYEYIPLLVEHKKLYHRINKPIGSGNEFTLTKLSLEDRLGYKVFWQLLRLGADLNLDLNGKNNSTSKSIIGYLVRKNLYIHLILSIYSDFDFNIENKDFSSIYNNAYKNRFTSKESKLTYLVLEKLSFKDREVQLKNHLEKLDSENLDQEEIKFVNNHCVEVFVSLESKKWKAAQEKAFNQLKKNSEDLVKEITEDEILYKAIDNIKFSLLNETIIKNNLKVNYRAIYDIDSEVPGLVYDPNYIIVDLSKEALKIKYFCTLKPKVIKYKYKDLNVKKEVPIVLDEEIIDALESQDRDKLNKKLKSNGILNISKEIKSIKKDLKKEILESKLKNAEEKFREDIREEILKHAVVEVPETSIKEKINRDFQQQKLILKAQNINFYFYMRMVGITEEGIKKGLRQEAINFFKFMVVLEEVAKVENIQVERNEVDEAYNFMSSMLNISKEEAQSRMPLDIIKSDIIQGKALDLIASLNKSEEEPFKKELNKNIKKIKDNYYQAIVSLTNEQWKNIQEKAVKRHNSQQNNNKNIAVDISKKEVRESAVHEAKYALINELVVENNFDLVTIPKTSIEKITEEELILKIILITKPKIKIADYKDIKVSSHKDENEKKSELILKLLENFEVDLPKEMIERMVYNSQKESTHFMKKLGLIDAFAMLMPDQNMYIEHLRNLSINQAKLDLILEAIAKEENLDTNKISDPEIIHINMIPYSIYYPDVVTFILQNQV